MARGKAPEVPTGLYRKHVEANGKRWENRIRIQQHPEYPDEYEISVSAGDFPLTRGLYGRTAALEWASGLTRKGYTFNG